MLKIKEKSSYLKYGSRESLKTTVRADLHEKLKILSVIHKQPISKMLDVMILDLVENEDSMEYFLSNLKDY